MSSGSGGKGRSSSRSRVQIPTFLQPLLNQSAGVAGGALGNLNNQINSGNLVAGFDPVQQLAQGLGVGRALDPNGIFQTATNTFSQAAQGQGLESFVPQGALNTLNSNGGLGSFIDPSALQALTGGAQGQAVPGMDILSQLAQADGVPQTAMDALQQTAGGDFLFGGQGFDQAVDAALRAARPGVLSTFGRSGAGGATGGLAQTAIAQAGIDAFARQFGQERQNQLSAANALGSLGLSQRGQTADIASRLGSMGLAGQQQQLGAAGALAGLGADERSRQLSSAGLLAQLGEGERSRQLAAAQALPGLGMADINVLSGIGQQRQDQAQNQISAPLNAQLQLLQAALGGLPIANLLGQNNRGTNTAFQLGFGGS